MINFIHSFWFFSIIPTSCDSSFIALVAKIVDPTTISDFQPISLVGSMYKILSKVLAERLKLVLPSIISTQQLAFIRDRKLLDGILIENEIICWAKKKEEKTTATQN